MNILLDQQNIVLFRQVATPIHEVIRILKIAEKVKMHVVIIEYSHDKFTPSVNSYKYNLSNLPIYNRNLLVNDESIITRFKIVDISKMEGLKLNEVTTFQNENIVDVHHELLNEIVTYKNYTLLDISEWFMHYGSAKKYYYDFFKFFLRNNILAEVYLLEGNENNFTTTVILPILKQISEDYSLKPLIWNYLEGITKNDIYFWDCYPSVVSELLENKGYHTYNTK
jgi:hypothetical protein